MTQILPVLIHDIFLWKIEKNIAVCLENPTAYTMQGVDHKEEVSKKIHILIKHNLRMKTEKGEI